MPSGPTVADVATPEPGRELERHDPRAEVGVPLPPMDDGELARLWRTSKALAESGLFKDARQAGQAFAKVLAGRDLGLTPFEAMSALHVIEGKIEASSDLHATRVRERDGYDFRIAWLKVVPPEGDAAQTDPPNVEAVWADEEDLADLRDIYGCAVVFYVNDEQRGVSRWTIADSTRANLQDKSGPGGGPGNHQKFPRNMYFSRAMTNGVAWFIPEVMGGVRVYGLGEISAGALPDDLTTGDPRPPIGDDPADVLPTAVEGVLARAAELGHAGLANRQAAAMAVADQSEEVVRAWCKRATDELNRMAAGHEPEPVDADVVDDSPPADGDEGAGTAETAPEASDAQEGAGDAAVDPESPEGRPEDSPDVAARALEGMRRHLEDVRGREAVARGDGDEAQADALLEEVRHLEASVDALVDPAQTDLGV